MTIEDFSQGSSEAAQTPVLFGRVMLPPPGQSHAHFDQDNINRRTYGFQLKNQKWIRNLEPLNELFPPTGWLGHNYGHQFITAKNGDLWMFYERVSEVLNDAPLKTEIFARRFTPPAILKGPEIQIFRIPSTPFPAVVRTNGNLLAESPRPFSVRLRHRSYYFVSFSSSDWGSDHYGINLLWSDAIDGPYQPILNSHRHDLKDFGVKIRTEHALTYGPGRGSFFQDAKGHWWVIFHAATLEARRNVQAAPNSRFEELILHNFFVAPVRIRLKHGIPDLEILERDSVSQ